MDDIISRQAALDALGEAPEVWTDSPEELAALSQWEMDVTAIKAVPSAEPKVRTQMSSTDCISRQAALKVACDTCQFVSCPDDDKCDEYEAMKNLPSAEPEKSTALWRAERVLLTAKRLHGV